jgi:Cyclic nucleotide-binding domain
LPPVVTPEEIGRLPIFAALDPAARDRLSRAAADISLAAGEYAVHEGEDQALFALIEGRIEPIKTVEGIERPVGERLPGDIFGEVPLALGTVFPVGFRASEPSRVMRIEAPDYHAVAAVQPDGRKGDRPTCRPSDGRIAWAAGPRCRAAVAAPDRRRPSLGCVLRRAATFPRPGTR